MIKIDKFFKVLVLLIFYVKYFGNVDIYISSIELLFWSFWVLNLINLKNS